MDNLDEKELQILYGELQGRRKSTGLAYVLFFFGGLIGLHQWYLGNWFVGLLYLGLGFGSIIFPPLFLLVALALLIDLFTLTVSVGDRNKEIKNKILAEIKRAK